MSNEIVAVEEESLEERKMDRVRKVMGKGATFKEAIESLEGELGDRLTEYALENMRLITYTVYVEGPKNILTKECRAKYGGFAC